MPATERAVELAIAAARAASDRKAQEIIALDVSSQLVLTDVFVIASGTNERQVGAIGGVPSAVDDRFHRGSNRIRRDVRRHQDACRDRTRVADETEHDMLGADVLVVEPDGFVVSASQRGPSLVVEGIAVHARPPRTQDLRAVQPTCAPAVPPSRRYGVSPAFFAAS